MNLPSAKRHAVGLGVSLGKRKMTHAFEEDGDESDSEDEEAEGQAKKKKGEEQDLGNIGFAQREKQLLDDVMKNQEDGVRTYGTDKGKFSEEEVKKWEDKDEVLEPFNLKQELEQGRFDDATGVYVENEKEETDPRDAWLDDFADRNGGKFAAAAAESEEEEEERKLTAVEIAELKRELAGLLNRGETTAKGLKRLRKDKPKFNTMTELADKLLNGAGDYGKHAHLRMPAYPPAPAHPNKERTQSQKEPAAVVGHCATTSVQRRCAGGFRNLLHPEGGPGGRGRGGDGRGGGGWLECRRCGYVGVQDLGALPV